MALRPNSQNSMILELVRRQGGVTARELAADYGILNYNARINELRRHGYPIVCTLEETVNRYGAAVKYGRYTMASY